MNCKEKLLEVRDLHKVYTKEGVPTKALNGITFNVLNGEYLGIMGASGSGKTTLLNCIATVIKPTAGQILLSGANIALYSIGAFLYGIIPANIAGVMEAVATGDVFVNLFTQPSARYVINILFFNWTYIVCGIAVSVLCVLILTKVQKNTENSK